MNKIIKNNFLITALFVFGCFATTSVISQSMDSSFSYQGELLDAGIPANGQYDINIDLIDGDLAPWGSTSVHSPVDVVNGLFNVNADFGISSFNGYKDFTITVSVRKTSEGPGGAFTTLGSETIQAVPMATNLTNGSATVGQVLTFNGFQWNPANPASGSSPWTVAGSEINFMDNVGIGVANPNSRLHVKSSAGLTSYFDGGSNMFVGFAEDGVSRGYIGSFVSGAGINDEDFEIGTYGSNAVGGLQFTIQNSPKMTIANNGKVGIGNVTPSADLNIDATADGDVMRVRVDGATKFYVDDNGGVGVGAWTTPPVDGLRVQGNVKLNQELNAPDSGDADMKAYVYGRVISTGSISVDQSSTGFSATRTSLGVYRINFTDTSINTNYMASATTNSSSPKFASVVIGTDGFDVHVWNTSGAHTDHAFTFVVHRK